MADVGAGEGGAGEGGGGLGGGGTWKSYQISMLHSPSIWGEHCHTCAGFQVEEC